MVTTPLSRLALAVAALGIACGDDGTGPGDGTLTVLFIGNSLTASNDLPVLTREVAVAGGTLLAFVVTAPGGVSLEDHWNAGVVDLIADTRADVVVLQQGPSSLPESQEHLRTWATQLATPIRQAGGEPALLMVWPELARVSAFDDVRDSYQGAAEAVDGIFIPAGEAWRAAWRRDPDLALYGFDGFHPSCLGSFVAALTVYAVLVDPALSAIAADAFPEIPADRMALLLDAVREVAAGADPVAPPPAAHRAPAGSGRRAAPLALPCVPGF